MDARETILIPDGPAQAPDIAAPLLAWYRRHARALPWRIPPGEQVRPDPYRVWLSEVMLQQTTTRAVAPYFARFAERWPTVESLAAAPEEEVMAAWAGLGYYSRARNLIACARELAALGRFPEDEEELRRLPGLGAYTAAAIAAIAFGKRAVVVDANVERVVARLFAVEQPLPAARGAIRSLADRITPDAEAGDFAQAMMDLGATVCTPRDPKCLICPVAAECRGRAQGDPARLPVKAAKRARPERIGTAWWIERAGQLWLVKRPPGGMLGGMRALPDDGWHAGADGSGVPPLEGEWRDAGAVRHSFTHFHLTLRLRVAEWEGADPGEGQWWPLGRLGEAGLPTLFAKAVQLGLQSCHPGSQFSRNL